jgi:hypothetical protein
MNTLEAFVFANETVSFEAIAKIWNRLHHTNLTAENIKAISAAINLRAHKISFDMSCAGRSHQSLPPVLNS